jgi:arylsulfate sulfotransferase
MVRAFRFWYQHAQCDGRYTHAAMLYSGTGGAFASAWRNAVKSLKYSLLRAVAPYAFAVAALLGAGSLHASTVSQVRLTPSPPSPQLLGATITLTASAHDSGPGPLTYKWEVGAPGASSYSLLRDFDVSNTFSWTPNYVEGTYQLRLTARDYLAGAIAVTVINFIVNPLITGTQGTVVATANPLVGLLSAPTCPLGSTMRVVFQQSGVIPPIQSFTDWRACHPGTQNFYLAGMEQSSNYLFNYQVNTNGTIVTSPQLTFNTGAVSPTEKFPVQSVPVPIPPGNPNNADTNSKIVLTGYAAPPFPITATDLSGNIIWYYPQSPIQLARPVPGGTMLVIASGSGTGTGVWGPNITRQQILREIDVAGNTVKETNCDRLMEQLTALGLTDPLGRFNHDAIRLGNLTGSAASLNGYTIVLGDVQRIFPAGTQGATAPVDVVGAIILILDPNFQVAGYWNAFDHDCTNSSLCLSLARTAVRNETCAYNKQGVTPDGCPPVLLSSPANDWLHSNAIQYLPSDGDLLMSARDQDWVVKIDYNNGIGTGNILWRLGSQGDFTIPGCPAPYTAPACVDGPYPWFSAQHSAGFATPAGSPPPIPESMFTVFDNGVSRHNQFASKGCPSTLPDCLNSRGQVWTLDQTNLTATLTVSADLGQYSYSLGSAALLVNGDYMFQSGNIRNGNSIIIQNTEISPPYPHGPIVYEFQGIGAVSYRGARLTDFYNVLPNGSSGPE